MPLSFLHPGPNPQNWVAQRFRFKKLKYHLVLDSEGSCVWPDRSPMPGSSRNSVGTVKQRRCKWGPGRVQERADLRSKGGVDPICCVKGSHSRWVNPGDPHRQPGSIQPGACEAAPSQKAGQSNRLEKRKYDSRRAIRFEGGRDMIFRRGASGHAAIKERGQGRRGGTIRQYWPAGNAPEGISVTASYVPPRLKA